MWPVRLQTILLFLETQADEPNVFGRIASGLLTFARSPGALCPNLQFASSAEELRTALLRLSPLLDALREGTAACGARHVCFVRLGGQQLEMQEALRRCYELSARPDILSRVCALAREILARALVNAAELLHCVLAIQRLSPPAAPLQPPNGASHCCSPLASSTAASTSSSSISEDSQSQPRPRPRPAPPQPQPLPPAPKSSEESRLSVKLHLRGMPTLSRQSPLPRGADSASRKRRRADRAAPSAEDDTVPERGTGHAHSVREERPEEEVKRLELERMLTDLEADPTDAQKEAALRGALPTGTGRLPERLRLVVKGAREALGRAERQRREGRRQRLEGLLTAFEAEPTNADKEAALWSALPSGTGSYPAELRDVVRRAREALDGAERQRREARREQARILQATAQRRTYQMLALVRARADLPVA